MKNMSNKWTCFLLFLLSILVTIVQQNTSRNSKCSYSNGSCNADNNECIGVVLALFVLFFLNDDGLYDVGINKNQVAGDNYGRIVVVVTRRVSVMWAISWTVMVVVTMCWITRLWGRGWMVDWTGSTDDAPGETCGCYLIVCRLCGWHGWLDN
jgi:hypothetical protein